jgi:adenylate kinase
MSKGLLVDDATMLEIIRDRVAQPDAQAGFILDGFPRTQTQAEALTRLMADLGTPLDAVVLFDVSDVELVRRISGRRTCSLCNKVFNIHTAPPPSPAADCVPGSSEHQLFQRKDDEEATVAERLRVYGKQTQPVLSYYSNSGLLRTVRAEGTPEQITGRLLEVLTAAPAKPAPAAKTVRRRRTVKHRPAEKAKARVRKVVRRKAKAVKRRPAAQKIKKKKRAAPRATARKTRVARRRK